MRFLMLIIVLLISCSCKKEQSKISTGNYYKPQIGDNFEWRLDSIGLNEVNQYTCKIIDIDAFSATKELVEAFHKRGIKVIAYISVGTFETYRPDRSLLPPDIIGNIYPAWPDERFLDLRQIEKLKPFITSRFDMIKAKGFDGIEPDNIDIYGEATDFKLTLDDTKLFCEYIIKEAHDRGLCIGQKNTEELVPLLNKQFDWALTENVFYQNTQNDYSVYISSGKPVFSAEYTDDMDIIHFNTFVCNKAIKLKYFAFLKHRDLTQWKYECK
ncbi:MAG: endo alpha-1,4 polygalactosaminidase [Bacteroidetes bacterium]|nr:endo alpha-1,4 polygalactosaminidase [Bacteroidota bacterium]